jgi:AraC-like DNA-binding protein
MEIRAQPLDQELELEVLLAAGLAAPSDPQAVLRIRPDGVAPGEPDGSVAVEVRLSVRRLRALLGDTPFAEALLDDAAACDGLSLHVRNTALVRRIAEEIRRSAYTGTILALFLQGKAIELLVEGLSESGMGGEPSLAVAVRDILLADPAAPPTMTEIARVLGVSPRKLGGEFKAAFGMTMPEYLADWRLARGRDLVIAGARPMAEIAAILGYAHLPTFTAAFTKKFGMPPTRLRAERSGVLREGEPGLTPQITSAARVAARHFG